MNDPKFRPDPEVERFMLETGVTELEAARQLGINLDEIWVGIEED
ncbi:hypothetical protein [Bacillus sp. V5-8f]|nr:hypothetical protein [Bacillus sp. V5-8f]